MMRILFNTFVKQCKKKLLEIYKRNATLKIIHSLCLRENARRWLKNYLFTILPDQDNNHHAVRKHQLGTG